MVRRTTAAMTTMSPIPAQRTHECSRYLGNMFTPRVAAMRVAGRTQRQSPPESLVTGDWPSEDELRCEPTVWWAG
jgi:hypothetical protein